MSEIITVTGKYFDATDPVENRLDIRDIAHALSFLCRGCGQVKTFYSVAQHCLDCAHEAQARGYSDRVALACLIHDASEAYMADMPRPVKEKLHEYKVYENRLLDLIYTHFLGKGLSEMEKKLVKEVDDAMLYFDLRDLLCDGRISEAAPMIHIAIDHAVRPFSEVEEEYLNEFERLSGRMQR